MSNDADTTIALGEAANLQALFESAGWSVAERVFSEYVATLKDVSTLDPKSPTLAQDVRDRINTASWMEAWLADLKGRVGNAMRLNTSVETKAYMERK